MTEDERTQVIAALDVMERQIHAIKAFLGQPSVVMQVTAPPVQVTPEKCPHCPAGMFVTKQGFGGRQTRACNVCGHAA